MPASIAAACAIVCAQPALSAVIVSPRPSTSIASQIASTAPPESPPSTAPEGPPPLSLPVLLEEAERANLELLAGRARRAAADHVAPQMEALPDPTASVSYTNETLTDLTLGASIDSSLVFSWTQEVPYPGKRRLAGDMARKDAEVSTLMLEAARLAVRAEVKKAYVELFRLDRTHAILQKSRKLLDSFLQSARSRYEAGGGVLENVLKAQTELTKMEGALAIIAQERRSVEVMLNALLGRPLETPLGPALALPPGEIPERESMETAALERSPEVLALRAATLREENRLELAKKSLKPDFMWGAAYMNRGGLDPMVMGMFGMRLPLYARRKQAEAVVQTQYELDAARRDVERREVQLLSEVRSLLARAERAHTLTRLYGEGVLPQARSALDSAASAYSAGRAEFITLIDDFLTVLKYEVDYETQRTEKVMALADLELLTGADLVLPGTGTEIDPFRGDSNE